MTETSEERRQEQEEIGLYERLASRTAEILDSSRKNLDEALKKAREEISCAGDYSREQIDRVSGFFRRDLAAWSESAGRTGGQLKKALDPQRIAYGVRSTFSRLLSSTAERLGEWAEKTERQLEFRTGELTCHGTLQCKSCGAEIHMKSTSRIPPCPKCHETLFRRSY